MSAAVAVGCAVNLVFGIFFFFFFQKLSNYQTTFLFASHAYWLVGASRFISDQRWGSQRKVLCDQWEYERPGARLTRWLNEFGAVCNMHNDFVCTLYMRVRVCEFSLSNTRCILENRDD